MSPRVLVRGHLLDVPGNPFTGAAGLRSEPDGAILIEGDRITARGAAAGLLADAPDATVVDHRGAFLLPGFIDTHVHFPQLPVIGSMGLPLLRWLAERTLPAEAALDTAASASQAADRFLRALAKNGTTSALVFGSHLPIAQNAFFERAAASGMRIASGLSLGDRELPDALVRHADDCYRESEALIARWHGNGFLRYAVTPRFSVSCSEAVLDACGALKQRYPGVMIQTHINENRDEISLVCSQFPWARDYFDTYER
ncbi:MAG: guanine deaminase, partial [Spirochaetaceae bacterium]